VLTEFFIEVVCNGILASINKQVLQFLFKMVVVTYLFYVVGQFVVEDAI
jgi:hypothetical protein